MVLDTRPALMLAAARAPASPLLPVLASSTAAYTLRNTALGQSLSAPMLSFAFSSLLSNVGVVPISHPAYEVCAGVLPFSVCFGLLAASTPAAADDAEDGAALTPMLSAFCVGAVGTVVGCLIAFALCTRFSLLPAASAACAGALYCATYVGGEVPPRTQPQTTGCALPLPLLMLCLPDTNIQQDPSTSTEWRRRRMPRASAGSCRPSWRRTSD